jgi:hypothetical protein
MEEQSISRSSSRATTPSGRLRRSTSNDAPQYNFVRARASPGTAKKVTATGSPQAQRGRGRPPKNSVASTSKTAKTSGRQGILKDTTRTSSQNDVANSGVGEASAVKQRRGRPSKTATIASPGRGRPRKEVAAATRGRGRPNKDATTSTTKAGRPKKSEENDGLTDDEAINKSIAAGPDTVDPEIQYWLMKAEPETRLEKGMDVKFSIDDLAAKTEPEGWDGTSLFCHPQITGYLPLVV